MRLTSRVAAALLIVGFAPLPALAAEIGIRSRGGGSPDVTDGSWYALQPCDTGGYPDLGGYFCQEYQFTGTPEAFLLWSVEFQVADRDGNYLAYNNGETGELDLSELSELGYFLSAGEGNNNTPSVVFQYSPIGTIECLVGDAEVCTAHFAVFMNGTYQVALLAYNIGNSTHSGVVTGFNNVAQALPIPEAGVLALLATGLAGVLSRRRGRGRG